MLFYDVIQKQNFNRNYIHF